MTVFVLDTFDFPEFSVGHGPQGEVYNIFVDVRVRLQVDLLHPVGTWFLVVHCVMVEMVMVVLGKERSGVYLGAFEYLFTDCEVRL